MHLFARYLFLPVNQRRGLTSVNSADYARAKGYDNNSPDRSGKISRRWLRTFLLPSLSFNAREFVEFHIA